MPRCTTVIRAVTVAAVLSLIAGGLPPPGVAATDAAGAIDAYLRSAMEASGIPGLAVAVVQDGAVVHASALGVAGPDGTPMTTRTPLVIGSVGKSITALAVRQQVEAGRVELDAPLRRYLPWFSLAAEAEQVDAVTVRSLLGHTSGLSTADGQDPRWYAPTLTPEAVARSLASVRPDRPVGTYEYSNLNYVLLGVLVEAVSGRTYGAYVADHIFEPLGMGDSATGPDPPPATGHRYLFGLPAPWAEPYPGGIVPAGYQVSTADDMARFVGALVSGGSWEGTDVLSGGPVGARPPPARVLGTDWQPLPGADPGVSSGQSGSTLTTNVDILVMPARGLGVVVLLNANPTQLLGLPLGAADIALDVLRLSIGLAPASSAPTVRSVYLVVDVLLGVLALLLVVHAWRARTWPERLRRARHRRWFLGRTIVADLLLPLAVLFGIPLAIGATGSTRPGDVAGGWSFVLWTLPDVGATLLVLAIAPLALGAWKLWAVRRGESRLMSAASGAAA